MNSRGFTAARRTRGLAALGCAAVLLLAACSGADQASGGDAASEPQMAPGSADEEFAAADAEGGDADGAAALDDVEAAERHVIHTADLTVEVEDVEAAAEDAKDVVADLGGQVGAEVATTERTDLPHTNLTLQVPADDYEAALDALSDLGKRQSLDRQAEDVTEEVADVESRVASAEASLEALRELMDEADTVEEVLDVEAQLHSREADLEALQARQQSLAEQTDFSTVRLELIPPDTYEPEDPGYPDGFVGGLLKGWDAFVLLGRYLATLAGWLLPFAVALAVLVAPLWQWRRRVRRRRASQTPDPAGAPAPVPSADGTGAEADAGEPQ